MTYFGAFLCVAVLGQALLGATADSQPADIQAAMSEAKFYCDRDAKRDQPERCDEARRNIEFLAHRNWTNVPLLNQLGDVYSTFNTTKAKSIFNRVIELDPANATAHYRLGLLDQRKDPEKAISHFQSAVSNDPTLSDARNALIETLIKTHHRDPTILAQVGSALGDDPDSWLQAWRLLAISDIDLLADRSSTRELIARYLQLGTLDTIPRRRRCRVFPDPVTNELIRGEDLQADFIETCGGYAFLALARASNEPDEKAEYLRRAAQLMPEHIWVHGELALTLIDANAPQEEIVPAILTQLEIQPEPQLDTWIAYLRAQVEDGNALPAQRILPAILDSSLAEEQICSALSSFPFDQDSTLKEINQRYKKLDCKSYERKGTKKS